MRLLLISFFVVSSVFGQSCDDFEAGSCPLSEDNIVGSNNGVDSPGACQTLCKYMYPGHECQWFTHFGDECYQLANCTSIELCDGCVSGPIEPPFDDCPWPPMNETTTAVPTTTMGPATTTAAPTTTIGPATTTDLPTETTDPVTSTLPATSPEPTTTAGPTTTMGPATTTASATTTIGPETTEPATTTSAPTTTMEPATTTVPPTTTPATTPEPTTTARPDCVVDHDRLCEWEGNLIEHIEHIHDVSDCQAICQNHANCEFWSHYLEEGGEHFGHCLLHYHCDQQVAEECGRPGDHQCPYDKLFGIDHEPRPGPHGRKCYCQNGGNAPDLDECGSGPLPCLDDFFTDSWCGEENIGIIDGITSASDCQAICQNHNGCEYFSQYFEEGPEGSGECYLYANCDRTEQCDWEEHCFSGPAYPDMDDCSEAPEL